MSDCKKCTKLFQPALNNELRNETKEFFESHLYNCAECSKEFSELQSTVKFMQMNRSEDVNEEFLSDLWKNIRPELLQKKSDTDVFEQLKGVFKFVPSWSRQLAGAAVILLVGIFLGRYFYTIELTEVAVSPEEITVSGARSSAIVAKADNYIERSKVLLLGLTNFDPVVDDVETINLKHQQSISRNLLSEAADLKAGLNKPSQANLKQLVSDLEIILMQIANLETEYDLSGIELVKQGVDRRGIFLKINIREMQQNTINSTRPSPEMKKEKNNI